MALSLRAEACKTEALVAGSGVRSAFYRLVKSVRYRSAEEVSAVPLKQLILNCDSVCLIID